MTFSVEFTQMKKVFKLPSQSDHRCSTKKKCTASIGTSRYVNGSWHVEAVLVKADLPTLAKQKMLTTVTARTRPPSIHPEKLHKGAGINVIQKGISPKECRPFEGKFSSRAPSKETKSKNSHLASSKGASVVFRDMILWNFLEKDCTPKNYHLEPENDAFRFRVWDLCAQKAGFRYSIVFLKSNPLPKNRLKKSSFFTKVSGAFISQCFGDIEGFGPLL